MAVSLSARCLAQAAQLVFKDNQKGSATPKGGATPKLLGSKTPVKTPGSARAKSPCFFPDDASDDKASLSPKREQGRPSGGISLKPPVAASSIRSTSNDAPSPSKRRMALRFAEDEALQLQQAAAEQVQNNTVSEQTASTYIRPGAYPRMLGQLGSLSQEPPPSAPEPAPTKAAPQHFDSVGLAPELARAAFMARRGTIESRTQRVVESKPEILHTAHDPNLEFPCLLGKESATKEGATPSVVQISVDDPAARARANFFQRRERIGTRRLGMLGA